MRAAAAAACGVLVLLAAACAQPLAPQDVADRFWRAVVAQQPAKIRRYVLAGQRAGLSGEPELLAIGDYQLGRVVIDGARADIETRVTLAGDTPVPVTIDTRLQQEDGAWRIDYDATVDAITAQSSLAQVIGRIGALGDTLKDGFDQSVDELSRMLPALESELARLEANIRQSMPELRAKIDEFARRLEDALEAPPEPPPSPPPPPGTDEPIAL